MDIAEHAWQMTNQALNVTPHRIRCGEIWGGNRGDQLEVATSGIRASLFSRPCDGKSGGDIYYFSVCSLDQLTRIAIVDIVGHGVAVSDMSSWLYGSLERRMNSVDGSVILAELNHLSIDRGEKAMATAAIAAFYRADSRLHISYAGHNDLLLCRRGETKWEALQPEASDGMIGLPLGVLDESQYGQESFECSDGDKLFLFTDGVVEAMDNDGIQFGTDRLLDVLRQTRGLGVSEIRQSVLDAILAHTGGILEHDDVTFMVIEIADADATESAKEESP